MDHWWSYWQRSVDDHLESSTLTEAPPENADDADTEALVGAKPDGSSATLPAKDIEENPFLAASLVSGSQPAVRNVNSVARSTEIIQLSDEVFRLKQEKEELEHQLRFKDQIIAMLAHDLRNPLTATSIALETLEMGHDSEEGWSARLTPTLTAQLLKHARTQTRAIDRMITDILQAARGLTPNSRFSLRS